MITKSAYVLHAKCDHEGCDQTVEVLEDIGKQTAGEARNHIRIAGWTIEPVTNRIFCPAHHPKKACKCNCHG